MALVPQICNRSVLAQQGRELQQTCPKFAQFAQIISHPEFANFFDTHFQTWEDCRTSIMLLKLGALVKQYLGPESSGQEILAVMHQALSDGTCRQEMVRLMRQYEHGHSLATIKSPEK